MKKICITTFYIFILTCTAQSQKANRDYPNIPKEDYTVIHWMSKNMFWGEIQDGDKVQGVFKFCNAGEKPLFITKVAGSCGCTVASASKAAIMPGDSSQILIQFDSSGRGSVQGSEQKKRITVIANTEPHTTYLETKGRVYKANDQIDNEIVEQIDKNFKIDAELFQLAFDRRTKLLNIAVKDNISTKGKLQIFDNIGVKKFEQILDSKHSDFQLDVSIFRNGIYNVCLTLEEQHPLTKQFEKR